MDIRQYSSVFRTEVISLILDIQNREAGIDLSLGEQPDLLDIEASYISTGGNFWVALDDSHHVVGTIAVMRIDDDWCVLKKFFVREDYRSRKVGLALYERLLSFIRDSGFSHIILDTPSVALKSHAFYERAGFRRVDRTEIPSSYHYPDRHSLLYRLDL